MLGRDLGGDRPDPCVVGRQAGRSALEDRSGQLDQDVTAIAGMGTALHPARLLEPAGAEASVSFVVADVTHLRQAGIAGPFDLLVDIGCYHAIPEGLRDAYVAEVAAVARPGADFYLAGISDPPATLRLLRAEGLNATESRVRFGAAFDIAEERAIGGMGRASTFVLYHLVRKQASPEELGRAAQPTTVARVAAVGLASQYLLDVAGVAQPDVEVLLLQRIVGSLPVHPGRLHRHQADLTVGQPPGQHGQPGRSGRELLFFAPYAPLGPSWRTHAVTESRCTSSPATFSNTCSIPWFLLRSTVGDAPPGRDLGDNRIWGPCS